MIDLRMINPLVLAFLGDAVLELFIREKNINKGIDILNDLQSETIKYVKAESESQALDNLINNNFFNEEELNLIKRTRNTKIKHKPRASLAIYAKASSLEAVIGFLYLIDKERLDKLLGEIYKDVSRW